MYRDRYIRIGVKFGVARFDTMGNFQDALNREASDGWASRFFVYMRLTIFYYNFDAVAPS